MEEKKQGFWAKLHKGLTKTRESFASKLDQLFDTAGELDDDFWDELDMILISSDIGVKVTQEIIDIMRTRVKEAKIRTVSEARAELTEILGSYLGDSENYEPKTPTIILLIGVNGVGKTTIIGKLGNLYKKQGKSVLFAAADTFRAAAIEQLEVWAERTGVSCIKHCEGSDAAAVIYDAINATKARNIDVLICDTAGRLQNKHNLMEELKKINSIVMREFPTADKQVWLALDATTGQNALQQAITFSEVADINGLILNKLDGTAKGGAVLSICREIKIPVRYIGIGEGIDDIQPFDAKEFCKALISN